MFCGYLDDLFIFTGVFLLATGAYISVLIRLAEGYWPGLKDYTICKNNLKKEKEQKRIKGLLGLPQYSDVPSMKQLDFLRQEITELSLTVAGLLNEKENQNRKAAKSRTRKAKK